MTVTPVVLFGPVYLANAATLLGSLCPANGKQIFKRVAFTNTAGVNHTITVYVSRNNGGGSLTNQNLVIDALSLSAGQSYVSPELANLVLGSNDGIYALSDTANVVTAIASGWQQ